MQKKRIFLFIILIAISSLILSSYINYRMIKIDNLYQNEFIDKFIKIIEEESFFYMKDLTPFEWDNVLIIRPYTSKTEMEKIVGEKWTSQNTYIGYLFEKTLFGEYPLDDDIFHKLIFIKDKEIVLDVTIERIIADFTQIDGIIYFNDDLLKIDKTESGYLILR